MECITNYSFSKYSLNVHCVLNTIFGTRNLNKILVLMELIIAKGRIIIFLEFNPEETSIVAK